MFGRKIPTNPEVCRCENCLAFLKVALGDIELPPDLEQAIDIELQKIVGRFNFEQLDEAVDRMQQVLRLAKTSNDEVAYAIVSSSSVRMSKLIADRIRAMIGEQPKPAAEPTPAPSPEAGANARLIAAAPDLLEACRLADRLPSIWSQRSQAYARLKERSRLTVESIRLSEDEVKQANIQEGRIYEAIRAAIAKAERGVV